MDNRINGESVNDIYIGLCNICDYGQQPDLLNPYERTIFVTQELEMEVNNGGFWQFFDNSSGQFSNEIVDAFTKIGAYKTAEICRKAVSAFGQDLPVDWEERRTFLDNVPDSAASVLDECDDAFFAYEEDLETLNASYIKKHIEHFTLTIENI
ncbi:MAG: DMP19 family protein [Oscillospiraceae bacterium]|nr:DMP19 family protein [Oscillospiraceae bacterium]